MKKFAFLIHPRDVSDVARRFWFVKILPHGIVEKILPKLKSGIICSHFDVFGRREGYILGVPLTARQMVTLPLKFVRRKILEGVLFAQNKLGVELIGLGALIASVTRGGKWLTQHPEVRIGITHGDAYAVAVAEDGIEQVIVLCKFDRRNIRIAIVGAYGIIGEALAKILIQKGYYLILVGRSMVRLETLRQELANENNITTSVEMESIYDADIVITVTSHPDNLINPDHLKQGTILYDIAQPVNVSPEAIRNRPDIIRIDGAYVYTNGVDIKFNMGLPSGSTFACLAETVMEALEGDDKPDVGKIDPLYIEKTKQWAEKYGFVHAPFTCFNKPISMERFREISELKLNGNEKFLLKKA